MQPISLVTVTIPLDDLFSLANALGREAGRDEALAATNRGLAEKYRTAGRRWSQWVKMALFHERKAREKHERARGYRRLYWKQIAAARAEKS